MVESERDSIKYCSSQGRRVPVEVTVIKKIKLRYLLTCAEDDHFARFLVEREASARRARTTHRPRRFSD